MLRLQHSLCGAIAGMCLAAGAASAQSAPVRGIVVEDLPYGHVLYEYYKEDYFGALTRLLVEEDFGRIDDNAAEAELLRGGLLLSFGLHREARPIFENLLAGKVEPTLVKGDEVLLSEQQIRDRAWFFLGKALFQRDYFDDAIDALKRCGDYLPDNLAAERRALLSQSYLESGQFGNAERLVVEWDTDDDFQGYALYNLGVALIRTDRLEEAVPYLQSIVDYPAESEEEQSLRDRANLAMGFGWLRKQQGAPARAALEQVRLTGPFSDSALLGYGWAAAADGDYRSALVPWLELRDRESVDPAYQEALLAIPYAYRKLQANRQAADSYDQAIDIYDAEVRSIDSVIAAINSGELGRQLLTRDGDDFSRWNWTLKNLPDTRESRYVYQVIATNQFQAGLRNYRDLQVLQRHLLEWRERLGEFNDIVIARREAYALARETLPEDLYATQVAENRSRYESMRQRLAGAEGQPDGYAVASAKERQLMDRIIELEQSPAFAAADAEVREKLRLFKGLVSWDMAKEAPFRAWRQQRDLDSLREELEQSELNQARFVAQLSAIPEQLDGYQQRAESLSPQVDELITSVESVAAKQLKELADFAIVDLQQRRDRVLQYRAQAKFAQAAIYDRSAAAVSEAP